MKKEEYDKNKIVQFVIWVITFVIVHGEMIFNKLSWHDDIYFVDKFNRDMDFGRIYGLSHGRFSLFFLVKIVENMTIEGMTASPVEQGIIAAVCSICMGYLILRILDIKGIISRAAVVLICISIPATAGNLGYMTVAGYDLVGALLAVTAAYCCICQQEKKPFILSAVLLAFAIGEYQCYLTLFLSILLCSFFKNIFEEEQKRNLLVIFIKYVVVTLLGLVMYLIINKAVLWYYHESLSDYGTINSYGIVSVVEYFERIAIAYKDFLTPDYTIYTMFPIRKEWHMIIVLVLLLELMVSTVYIIHRKGFVEGVLIVLSMLVTPVIFNFNIVMYGTEPLHALHQYQYIMLYALIIMLADLIHSTIIGCLRIENDKLGRLFKGIVGGYVILISFLYIRYDNLCYMEAELRQNQAVSYFDSLISDIHNTEGYYNEIPVCYVNEFNKRLPSNHDNYQGKNLIITNPYNEDIMGNIAMNHSWREYMYQWCNYAPVDIVHISQMSAEAKTRIEKMPRYPDKGSIEVIEDTLIVNF